MKYAFCVLCADRPEYTQRIIDNIQTWVDIETVDWYFVQAGPNHISGDNSQRDEGFEKSLQILQNADLPNKNIIYDQPDAGLILARDKFFKLFDVGYDAVVWFENDMLSSKYTIPLYKQMLEEFPKAVISLYRYHAYDDDEIDKERLDEFIVADDSHWFTFGITEETFRILQNDWRTMKKILIENGFEWPNTVEEVAPPLFGEGTPRTVNGKPKQKHQPDATFSRVCRKNNIPFIYPFVSRASNIGENGQSMSEKFYRKDPVFGNEGPMTFEEDENGIEFKYGGSRFVYTSTEINIDIDHYESKW